MSIFDQLISLWAPYNCLACYTEGNLLCAVCLSNLKPIIDRCYRCHRLSPRAKTCTSCRSSSHLKRIRIGTHYSGAAKQLVWQLKFSGAQAAAQTMANYLMSRHHFSADTIFVPVPTATGRVRRRGYDQARLLTRALSRQTGLPRLDCLVRINQAHQVGASRHQRLHQLQTAFRVNKQVDDPNIHIVLIDDVLTTGATLEAAARVLKLAGFKQIEALVFAQA